jgi:hypothetical protein
VGDTVMANYSNYVQTPVEGVQLFEVVTEPPSRDAAMIAANYLKLDGSVVSQATYPELFAEIGLNEDGDFFSAVPWTTVTTPGVDISDISAIKDDNIIVSINNGTIATTTNLVSLTAVLTASVTLRAMHYNGEFFVIEGRNSNTATTGRLVYTSTNAANWTSRSIPSTLNADFVSRITFGDNKWVIYPGTSTNNIRTSTDTITWTTQSVTGGPAGFSIFNYVNNQFVGIVQNFIYTSTNAINWSGLTYTTRADVVPSSQYLIFDNNTYFWGATISNNIGLIFSSTDLITFSSVSFARTTGAFRGVFKIKDFYMALITNVTPQLLSSTNGINWNASPTENVGPTGNLLFHKQNTVVNIRSNFMSKKSFYSYDYFNDFLLPTAQQANGLNTYVKAKP